MTTETVVKTRSDETVPTMSTNDADIERFDGGVSWRVVTEAASVVETKTHL